MEINLKNKTVLVFDYGEWIEVAIRLCREYGRVLYYCPFDDGLVKHNPYIIGRGISDVYPNFERVDNYDDYYDDIDLWVFTSLYKSAFQERLRGEGKLVFGSGKGGDMELYRSKMKVLQQEIGLPINEYEECKGITVLRKYLKDKKNLWIKSDFFRGDNETWFFIDMELSSHVLDELESDLGANKEYEIFIVEKPINNAVEVAYDGFVVDGRYTRYCPVGVEIKNSSYVMKLVQYDLMPEPLKLVTDKLSIVFSAYGYRGSYGNEVRITNDGKGYLMDMTCRQSQPPTSIQLEIIENYGECVWKVAYGLVPELKFKYRYGAQIIMKCEWAYKYPVPIRFDEKYKDFVKVQNLFIDNGIYKYIPRKGKETEEFGLETIGSVIGLGNSLDDAISMANKIADTVEGHKVICNGDDLLSAKREVDKLSKKGIKLF